MNPFNNMLWLGFDHCRHCADDCGFKANNQFHPGKCSYTSFGWDTCIQGSLKVWESMDGEIVRDRP